MSRRAEAVSGFTRNHQTLIIVARIFAGFGWLISLAGIIACGFTWGPAGEAFAAVFSGGMKADMAGVTAGAAPFFSSLMMILTGFIVVAYAQVMRVVSSIEANTQASFLLLDRRLPNPHPDADTYAGFNDPGLGSIPM